MTFRERMGTVRIDPRALPNKLASQAQAGTYFDDEPLKEAFGADAATREQQMLEATKGLGPAQRDTRGELWRRDRASGEAVRVSQTELDQVYLGGDSETETR
jgi:hypothetical protein